MLAVFQNIFLPSLIMLAIALLCGLLLVVLSQVFSVEKDARIGEVEKLLAGINCGGCGYPGCAGFAEAVVANKAELSSCNPTSAENKAKIKELLGLVGSSGVDTVAVVNCNGGNFCKDKFEYQGYGDCQSAQLLAGGTKMCPVGCMGLATCSKVCPHFAITVKNDGFAYVDRESCTSCGACIQACPKVLISRIHRSAPVYVACSNDCKGKDIRDMCSHGCIGCGICAKVCPTGAITMVDNLPLINYELCNGCLNCVLKCPTKVMKKH